MRIAIDIWQDSDFQEVGNTILNTNDNGYIKIQSCYLKAGMNDIRIRAVEGTGKITIIVWDQIKCQLLTDDIIWDIGKNNNSSNEFEQENYTNTVYI